MMRNIAIFLAFCWMQGLVAYANPGDYPTKAFDAVYQRVSLNGISTYRMCTDGKGHMRTENQVSGQDRKMVVIMDYPKNEMLMLLDTQKLVMKMPLKADTNPPTDEGGAKALGGKSLGQKVIDSHPCHGFSYTQNGTTVQSWTGDDTGCLVESTTQSDGGKETMHLTKYSKVPPADAFAVPQGYREVKGNGVASAPH
jgi:hypothetical protein